MNYSQQEIEKKQKNMESNAGRKKYRVEKWTAYCGVILAITLLLLLVFGIAGSVRGIIDSSPEIDEKNIMAEGQSGKIYDSQGKLIQSLDAKDIIQEYVSVDKIPKCVTQAFIAIEDNRFYEHHGVDMFGLVQSLWLGLTGEKSDVTQSETITQQLIQNQLLDGNEGNSLLDQFTRRIKEQHLAIELEDELDKSKILEYYLNTVNMGQNIVGVQAASRRYFDKDISELNLSEGAVLAAMAADPSEYSPITDQENNVQRRQLVLKNMLDENYISEDEYEDALGDDVYLRIQNVNSTEANAKEKTNSYYSDAVVEQVIADLKDKLGYSQTEAYNALYHSGLRIYTCQEPTLQKICDEVINSDSYYPKTVRSYLSYHLVVEKSGVEKEYSEVDIKNYFLSKKGKNISLYLRKTKKAKAYVQQFKQAVLKNGGKVVAENIQLVKQPQASFVLIEQATGEVKAIVGGRGQKLANRDINRATESKRQPGTVLAMLSTYAPALDTAGVTLGDVQDDTAYHYPGTDTDVRQWNNSGYRGFITLRQAIKNARSVPAVKTLEKISVQTGYEYLRKFNFTTIVEKKRNEDGNVYTDLQLQLALGELNEGVTNLELTAAYAAIANQGVYQEPRFYTKIVDRNGNVLLENKSVKKRVLKETTASLLTGAMKDVVQSGSGSAAKFDRIQTMQAGNVGHTEKRTDLWFEGYTPYYTAGIWSGQDENTSVEESDYHMVIWKEIMERIHQTEDRTFGKFQKTDHIISRQICSKCGNLAVEGLCDQAQGGSTIVTERFVAGTEPQENCTCHIKYTFCGKTNALAGENCPKEDQYDRVLLQKQETSKTADSPNIVTEKIKKELCKFHNK